MTLSIFEANSADFGGGIHNVGAAGTLKVDRSTFSDNTTIHYGAGIYNGATLWVKESTFNGNNAEAGGGIYNDSAATVDNSTFCGNTVSDVGGGIINNRGTLTLNNSTFDGNAAGSGGGIGNSAMLHYRNTIIANSTSGGDCLIPARSASASTTWWRMAAAPVGSPAIRLSDRWGTTVVLLGLVLSSSAALPSMRVTTLLVLPPTSEVMCGR